MIVDSMIVVVIGFLGLLLGSCTNALVWRLKEAEGVKSEKKRRELSVWRGRSMCPECKHQLSVLDLVPVLSWIFLKGRCRYCKKLISWQYPLVELISGILFAVSYIFWPLDFDATIQYMTFGIWLLTVVVGLALAVYDTKWQELPTHLVYWLGGCAAVMVVLLCISTSNLEPLKDGIIGSVLFGGFFYALYVMSNERWIGGGDVRLGFVLGALLGWQKSLLCLALASYIGTAIVFIVWVMGKYKKNMKLPFGPLLLVAAFTAFLWGQQALDWYLRLSGL